MKLSRSPGHVFLITVARMLKLDSRLRKFQPYIIMVLRAERSTRRETSFVFDER